MLLIKRLIIQWKLNFVALEQHVWGVIGKNDEKEMKKWKISTKNLWN